MYSNLFEHMRELRRLGLPVNVHTATLTPLPKARITEVPSRIETRSLGSPPIQGYGPPVAKGSEPILLQSSRIFRYRGLLYPQSLNGHLHARIPLETLKRKAVMARQIAFKLEEYTKKPPKTYKTRSRDEYMKLAKVAQLKADDMEAPPSRR